MSAANRQWPFTRTTLLISGALLIWLATFTCVYVLAALGCALTFDDVRVLGFRIVPLVSTLMIAGASAAAFALMRRALAKREGSPLAQFIRFVCIATGGLAFVSLLLLWLPPLFLRQAACT